MNLITLIDDSFHYTLKNWKILILLGIILCMASSIEELHLSNHYIIVTLIFIISTVLLFFEEGYRSKIIETTLDGENAPPSIVGNHLEVIVDGFKEILIIYVYMIVFGIMYGFGVRIMDITDNPLIWIPFIVPSVLIYICFFGAAINKALNDGKMKSAFNIKEILRLYYKLGIFETLFIIIIESISLNIVISCILDLGILRSLPSIDFILSLIVSPIFLLFTTRLFSMCVRQSLTS
ncbi:DUF4013 domain-containing protein [Methanobrevibacter sp.]|uniref:DUF4013 domain-containing protein n=1 Tax=Methanobrevibacter sp. TaxID=66852 RepID=UPI00388F7873